MIRTANRLFKHAAFVVDKNLARTIRREQSAFWSRFHIKAI